jgi:hypothetical protein
MSSHRPGCVFGPGFYRVVLSDGGRRFCQTEQQVEAVRRLLPPGSMVRVQRDACLDPLEPDESARGVVDGEAFLAMPRERAMIELGIDSEADYERAYRAIEAAVLAADRAAADGRDRASVVIKKRRTPVQDLV